MFSRPGYQGLERVWTRGVVSWDLWNLPVVRRVPPTGSPWALRTVVGSLCQVLSVTVLVGTTRKQRVLAAATKGLSQSNNIVTHAHCVGFGKRYRSAANDGSGGGHESTVFAKPISSDGQRQKSIRLMAWCCEIHRAKEPMPAKSHASGRNPKDFAGLRWTAILCATNTTLPERSYRSPVPG